MAIQCKKYNCPIIIHSVVPFKYLNTVKLNRFIEIVKKVDIDICLENSGESIDGFNIYKYSTVDVCFELNKLSEKEIFYPLLDICHYKKFLMTKSFPQNMWKTQVLRAIDCYASRKYYIHFCNMEKDAIGPDHGQNFIGHEQEAFEYLDEIYKCNNEAILVMEIYETDHTNKPNTKELNKMIKLWESVNFKNDTTYIK